MNKNHLVIIATLAIIGSQWLLSTPNAQEGLADELQAQAELQNELQNELIDTLNEIKNLLLENGNQQYVPIDSYDGNMVRLDTTDLEDAIREIIREENQHLITSNQPSPVASKTIAISKEQSELAFSESTELLAQAISYGSWNTSLAINLRPKLASMSLKQRKSIYKQYFDAVENGQIDMKEVRPPF